MEKEAEFLTKIVEEIVDNPGDVKVAHEVDKQGVKLTLSVAKDDMGKIIGSKGSTADALRTILRSYGGKHNSRVALIIEDPEQDNQ